MCSTTGWLVTIAIKYAGGGAASAMKWIVANAIKYGLRGASWVSTSGTSSMWRAICLAAGYTWHVIEALVKFLSKAVPLAIRW